ncbi:peroxidasin homolog pxn-1-like [Oculina patagonica]
MVAPNGCDSSSPYRTQNGQCNNLNNPHYGAAMTPFRRIQPSSYDDGTSKPRNFKLPKNNSVPLPNARLISKELFPQSQNPDSPWQQSPQSPERTNMASVFGQFLTHDITLTWHGGRKLNCPDLDETECFDIPIVPNDSAFSNSIPMSRASRCENAFGQPQEQVNIATAFIDASHIYGNNEVELDKVRDLDSLQGLLRTTGQQQSVKNLLPQLPDDDTTVFCRSKSQSIPCFYTGDYRRNNVSPALNAMHTVWVREHNRIALALGGLNTDWDKEKIFQETRKIIGAMMQHITYNEYLPTILSEQMLQAYDLKLNSYTGYNSSADASIANSFAAAALRFGHSTIGKAYIRPGHLDVPVKDFHDPTPLYNLQEGGVDGILKGLLQQSARKIDRYFSWSVTKSLIPGPGVTADLAAINIQRGRDHGLPAYVEFRDMFSGHDDSIPADVKTKMLNLYDDIQNVDLYVGGLLENPEGGAHIGPTFSHILAEGFKNLRQGDRFWYQNDHEFIGFSPDQLKEIQSASLAKIMCDNSDGIVEIQPRAMLKEGPNNHKTNCNLLPFMDLYKWKDGLECYRNILSLRSLLWKSSQNEIFASKKLRITISL